MIDLPRGQCCGDRKVTEQPGGRHSGSVQTLISLERLGTTHLLVPPLRSSQIEHATEAPAELPLPSP